MSRSLILSLRPVNLSAKPSELDKYRALLYFHIHSQKSEALNVSLPNFLVTHKTNFPFSCAAFHIKYLGTNLSRQIQEAFELNFPWHKGTFLWFDKCKINDHHASAVAPLTGSANPYSEHLSESQEQKLPNFLLVPQTSAHPVVHFTAPKISRKGGVARYHPLSDCLPLEQGNRLVLPHIHKTVGVHRTGHCRSAPGDPALVQRIAFPLMLNLTLLQEKLGLFVPGYSKRDILWLMVVGSQGLSCLQTRLTPISLSGKSFNSQTS